MPNLLKRLLRWTLLIFVTVTGLAAVIWSVGALHFDLPAPKDVRSIAIGLWLGACVAATWFWRKFPQGLIACGVAFLVMLAWWLSIKPRLDRDWKPEVARLPYAVVEGDRVTVHEIRNFEYRTKDDFTPRYDTRVYSLSQLRGIDVFQNYWGSKFMAHPIISFDFGDQGHLAFSIETRPERGEKYSAIGGLYRQFELIVIAADERDVVRVRTNYRQGEDTYLYRLKIPPEKARARFLEYVKSINALREKPHWYNAITHNCTTSIRAQHDPRLRTAWDWRILANGYADEMLYEKGGLEGNLPFAELKQRAHINERARASGDAPDFSEKIRVGLTGN